MRHPLCSSASIVPRVTSPNMQSKAPVQNAEVKDCFPECCVSPLTSCAVCKNTSCNSWLMFRWRTRMLVEHRYFEWFILFTVLISSLVLVRFSFYPNPISGMTPVSCRRLCFLLQSCSLRSSAIASR